ncbi:MULTISPECIES: dTDP-4-dehydrorhamnose reductase [unclassified Vibrio]|uniref:dTDP-4-dehydrorhamnose reductase n=1 Tax=Vibrio sp. HB236076 TaxID=3232307 RepID=A0AB39HHD2_9VIBR|nr:dTDP-4-dehydrorhamnose reductase [Vibrio sp. HB161653]MDP5254351.1 dTDP-4-dehydrorhamnose reductase [Vibrio sp. HB161653]
MSLKILVTGLGGQLAYELGQTQPDNVEMVALGIDDLDITSQENVQAVFNQLQPDWVINAAAYTAVDKAESDTDTAYAVNETGSELLAKACDEFGARLIHVSTDFVFDGTKTTPYQTDDVPNPINVYGASKLAGDLKVAEILQGRASIIRTAWVYSAHGNNFVKTMLRLMSEKEQLGIVYDQVGTPTWAKGLAEMIWSLLAKQQAQGVTTDETLTLHWTDAGVASWYDFAVAIQELGLEKGLLDKAIPVGPIPASNYPTPATRPSFSVIDKSTAEQASGVQTVHWRKQLSQMMDELKAV